LSDYLWDGSGEPDPDVARLEQVLGPLKHRAAPSAELLARLTRPPRLAGGRWIAVAAAAAVLVAGGSLWRPAPAGWELVRLAAGSSAPKPARLHVGEWLDTGEAHARLNVGRIGRLELEPRTQVRLLDAGRQQHRLALSRGELHAEIWAPPGQFLVETPSARALDLGCEYTLRVEADGGALLRVEHGWVALEWAGRESFVPAGALCRTRPAEGPGVPLYEDATPTFRAALERLEHTRSPEERESDLDALLAQARVRDAPTLWHLLGRLSRGEAARVFDRLDVLVAAPPGVTRVGVVAGDREMLDAWWDELGLGSVSFWRQWKGPDLSSR